METKLNIAEILKDKSKGTKLYTDAFGELSIEDIFAEDELGINLSTKDGDDLYFYNDGKYNVHGEPILFPSKEMRDWSKFSWKKGDVLVSKCGKTLHVIFEGFEDDTYTRFKGKHYLCNYDDDEDYNEEEYNDYKKEVSLRTIEFEKDNEDAAQTYINTIEERLGGKLNRETLEIEPAQPEFKDGDILSNPSTAHPQNHIFIFSKFDKNKDFEYHVALVASGEIVVPTYHGVWCRKDSGVRYATEEEKQQLFDALAKEGKAWDAEKKQIVDLKPKMELKPFDKVLCRDDVGTEWHIDLFESTETHNSYNYKCMANYWKICIPYEGNESLLGTTKDVEG